jgi:hypothetical protein
VKLDEKAMIHEKKEEPFKFQQQSKDATQRLKQIYPFRLHVKIDFGIFF